MTLAALRGLPLAIGLVLGIVAVGASQSTEVAGMVTELKPGRGRVEMKPTGAAEWRAVGPLLALRPGDMIRATDDAGAGVVLTGGRGSMRVDAASSPQTIASGQVSDNRVKKAGTLLATSVGFLARPKEEPRAVLATRAPRPPALIGPRNGPVLPGPLAFEWQSNLPGPHIVRVRAPEGLIFERGDLTGGRLEYPAQATPLVPGVRYVVRVSAGPQESAETWFEILPAAPATTIRDAIADLDAELGAALPPSSLVAVKAGLLASHGLAHDARLLLLAALDRDPGEPTLHALLAQLYTSTGLHTLAAGAAREAERLARGTAPSR